MKYIGKRFKAHFDIIHIFYLQKTENNSKLNIKWRSTFLKSTNFISSS